MAPKAKEQARKSDKANSKKAVEKSKIKNTTDSTKAGLIFPVGRIGRFFKQGRYSERFGKGAAVFAAATLQYLVAEILEVAGNAAQELGKKTIQPRHLQLAVRNDEELAKLMAATMISNGGYMTNIHPFLIQEKKGGKKGGKGDLSAT